MRPLLPSSLGFSPDARNRSDPSSLLPPPPGGFSLTHDALRCRIHSHTAVTGSTPDSMSQENCLPQIVHKTGPGRARAATVVARATGETYRLRMARTRPLHAPPCCVRDTVLQVARHPAILVAWSTGEIHRLAWRNSSLPEPPLRYTLRMARSTKRGAALGPTIQSKPDFCPL